MKKQTLRCKGSSFYLIFIITLCQFFGCSPDPDELYNEGALLAEQGKFEAALDRYAQMNQSAGDSTLYVYKALFGKAEVYRLKGDLEAQSDVLNTILDQSKYETHHVLIREKLEENLLNKAQKERLKPDPQGALPLYRKALELNPKSAARNFLIDYLIAQADSHLHDRRISEALDNYAQAQELNQSNETLSKRLSQKIRAAKYITFKLKAEQLFATQAKQLAKQKLYDPQTKTFYHKLMTYVEGRVNRKNQQEQLKQAKSIAQQQAKTEVANQIKELFALNTAPQVNDAQITVTKGEFNKRMKRIKLNGKRVRATPFEYHFTMPLEAVYELAYEASETENISK